MIQWRLSGPSHSLPSDSPHVRGVSQGECLFRRIEINSTNIDSEIVALSEKDVLKPIVGESDNEGASVKVVLKLHAADSDNEVVSANDCAKAITKDNDSDIVTTLFLFKPISVRRSSDALAVSSSA